MMLWLSTLPNWRKFRDFTVSTSSLGLDYNGVELHDVVSYTRAWHGFAATISATDRPRLGSLGVRLRPDRRLFPQLSQPVTVLPEAVKSLYDRAIAAGHGRDNWTSLYEVVAQRA